MQEKLDKENIFKLLKLCDSMSVEKGKQLCIDYAVENDDLFSSNEAEILGFKLYQEVTAAILKTKKNDKEKTAEVQLGDSIVDDFKNIFQSNTKDITFIFKNEEVKAHKAFLVTQSSDMTEFINRNEDPKKPGIYVLDPKYAYISPQAFEAMLKLFCYSEQHMETLHACQLFIFSREMNLTRLTQVVLNVLGKSDFSLHTVLPMLDVAYHPLMNEYADVRKYIVDNVLRYALTHMDKIEYGSLKHMSPKIAAQILSLLQLSVGHQWFNIVECTTPRSLAYMERRKTSSFNTISTSESVCKILGKKIFF